MWKIQKNWNNLFLAAENDKQKQGYEGDGNIRGVPVEFKKVVEPGDKTRTSTSLPSKGTNLQIVLANKKM